jgi:DNA-binding NarL/FixJ family response regulator
MGSLATSRIRVLVVDDFEPFRSFVCSTLKQKPEFEVLCELSDGLAAVQKVQELHPDLILLDIGLPLLNGIEAARQIRRLVPKSRIIFLSQESSAAVVREAFGLGANGYVVKKNAGSELLAAVEAVLKDKQFVSQGVKDYNSGEASGRPFPAEVPPPDAHSGPRKTESTQCHEVEFYSDEELLLDRFGRYVAAALKGGKAAIAIATERHRDGLVQKLLEQGVDVAAAVEEGRYVSLDVAEALSTFMVDGLPDHARFFKYVGGAAEAAARAAQCKPPRVVACGECAPSLLADGKADAAVMLERLTNELIKRYDLDVLCAYPRSSFGSGKDHHDFERICAEHSTVYLDGNTS